MAEQLGVVSESEIVAAFLVDTCQIGERHRLNLDTLRGMRNCAWIAAKRMSSFGRAFIPLVTGSSAELYIRPMYSCVADIDTMAYSNTLLAIPAGCPPPAELQGEFHSKVDVHEIVDSGFPGYVYLVTAYVLTECCDEGKYSAADCRHRCNFLSLPRAPVDVSTSGPAFVHQYHSHLRLQSEGRIAGSLISKDDVFCLRCLSWPTQAAGWPTRHRENTWPDSATIDRVVSSGCDVVRVAHRMCRQDEWMSNHQWRLSFSRAEIVLLNSWIPEQQIVYHMLRTFTKTEGLKTITDDTGSEILNNYNAKTLMMWACELKSRNWWTYPLNVVETCVELLHTMAVWLAGSRCPHYFVGNCNLFLHDRSSYHPQLIAGMLMSVTDSSLAEWFISNYVHRCAGFCDDHVSHLFDDVSTGAKLRDAVSAIAQWKLNISRLESMTYCTTAQKVIIGAVYDDGLTVRSCLCWMRALESNARVLCHYFTAVIFLHVAQDTRGSLNDELLDILATTCLRSNDARCCLNARDSSALSLSQAAKLMKVVANNSCSTVQLIEIELSKAYLYRASRCKDSDNDSIYCLAYVYLAVLYYSAGQYQTAIDHCTLVTGSQDHSQCSTHVVQGELLPQTDDDVDIALGLSVLYQHVQKTALNQKLQCHTSVFCTNLFAKYLHFRSASVRRCYQNTQMSCYEELLRYQKLIAEEKSMFTADVLLFCISRTKHATNDHRQLMVAGYQTMPVASSKQDTSELVDLLQKSAVEHLAIFRRLEVAEFGSECAIVTTDFESLFAYKRGDYRRCLRLSVPNVRGIIGREAVTVVPAYPEFIQLMDDDIASVIGLTLVAKSSCREDHSHAHTSQLSLSLYLVTQCQIKLGHSLSSLAQTLDYIKVARRNGQCQNYTLDQLMLKLCERRIIKHVRGYSF